MKMRVIPKWALFAGVVLALLSLVAGYLLLSSGVLSQNGPRRLTRHDLDSIHLGMTLDEISGRLGAPRGRALYMYQYQLVDDSQVILRIDGAERLQGIWILRKDGVRVDFFSGETLPQLSLRSFDFLERNMPYEKVLEIVGEPYLDTGSGMHVVQYELDDGSTVTLHIETPLRATGPVDIVVDAWINLSNGVLVGLFDNR